MKVLFVGAHFDDIEIGVGGVLIKHVDAKDEVWMAITSADEWRTGYPEIREEEQLDVLFVLEIAKSRLLMFGMNDPVSDVVGRLDAICPDIIYVPHGQDTHQDHVRAFMIGNAAGRKTGMNVFYYNSGSAYNFIPNLFVPIDFKRKMDLVRCFRTQNYYPDKIKATNALLGMFANTEYAEGLLVGRYVFNPSKGKEKEEVK